MQLSEIAGIDMEPILRLWKYIHSTASGKSLQMFWTYHHLFWDQHMPFESFWGLSGHIFPNPLRQVATWLSNGSTLARWSASVNQAGPMSFSSCGVNGILMPQNSPSAFSPTTWSDESWVSVEKWAFFVKETGEGDVSWKNSWDDETLKKPTWPIISFKISCFPMSPRCRFTTQPPRAFLKAAMVVGRPPSPKRGKFVQVLDGSGFHVAHCFLEVGYVSKNEDRKISL